MHFDGYRFNPNSKPHGDIECKPVTEEEVKKIQEMMSQFDIVEPIFYANNSRKEDIL